MVGGVLLVGREERALGPFAIEYSPPSRNIPGAAEKDLFRLSRE
jgi:hypothetical protein